MKYLVTMTILFALSSPVTSVATPLVNQMTHAPSPYLQQHAQDKVRWQTWSPASLALAKEQRKPILLSIGYYACHWCHVMQKESYQNNAVADLLNEFYIPIKIDRELEPGLDQAMLSYAKSRIGVAGWPLNVYLTSDARPFDAHVYLDAPSLTARLAANQRTTSAITSTNLVSPTQLSQNQLINKPNSLEFAQSALSQIDHLNGGFIGTRKFPQTPQLRAIAHYLRHTPEPELTAWLNQTLSQMTNNGLYDAVNGGFFRYTVDSEWRIPHFEKMLVDNAQLWQLYTQLAKKEASAEWSMIAEQTLNFMLTYLYDAQNGAFFTSLSALDNQGHEGGHYLWTLAQLHQQLSPTQLALINQDWQLPYPPSFDAGYLPIWGDHSRSDKQRQAIYERLQQARASVSIDTDRKHLVSYNGMMLSLLSQQLKSQPNLNPITTKLFNFIRQSWQEGKLSQGSYGNKTLAEADLEGYAFAAKGLIDYAIITGDGDASELSIALLQRSKTLFVNDTGFIAQAVVGDFSLPREAAFADTALISSTSVWIEACLQSRHPILVKQAEQRIKQALPLMQQSPLEYASLWSLYWKWQPFLQLN
jgi:uncharacterized protein YyaL (SSP411 family)